MEGEEHDWEYHATVFVYITSPHAKDLQNEYVFLYWVQYLYLYLSVSLPRMAKTCEIINDKHKGDKDKVGKSKNDNNKKDMDKGDKIENDIIYLYHFPACRRPAK